MLTRRSVLKYGLFGAGALAVGGITLWSRSTVLRTPRAPLRLLTPQEYSIVAAVADRAIPENRGFISASDAEVAERVDMILANSERGLADEIRQLLHLFENALFNFAFDQRARTFTRMDPAEQDAALKDWASSRLRIRKTGFKALVALVTAAYYSNPTTYASVGYPGPPEIGPQGPSASVTPASALEDPS